jgi:HEPN domain-containing protein
MKPHIDEALRSLRLADRDIKAFEILKAEPEAPISVVCFHAQQAVEKSLKAVLFSRQIEFERTHDLVQLAHLLHGQEIGLPAADDQLRQLNPFAVTFRYDDMDIESVTREDAAKLVADVRRWAGKQVSAAAETEIENDAGDD